jgi:hypothetical protein
LDINWISPYYQVSGGVKRWAPGIPLPLNETAMMEALARAGPLSIGIDSKFFDHYKRGVMSPSRCKGNQNSLDHQVLIVGYGTEPAAEGKQAAGYWKIKNCPRPPGAVKRP